MDSSHYLSIAQVADELGVHTKTIRELIARGELPASRIGSARAIRIKRADVAALLRPVESLASIEDVSVLQVGQRNLAPRIRPTTPPSTSEGFHDEESR